MSRPDGFKIADFGGEPEEVWCSPGFQYVTIRWSDPELWLRDEGAPISKAEKKPGYLYLLSWDHHRALRKDTIAYVGLTSSLATRFLNHPKASELVARKRRTYLSVGHIDFGRLKTTSPATRQMIEELEHILIWALWPTLLNDRKQYCLPGWGLNGSRPWHIENTGYRFSGRMPREIVFPWMLIKPGRDRSVKS